jgi:hypothetical protein
MVASKNRHLALLLELVEVVLEPPLAHHDQPEPLSQLDQGREVDLGSMLSFCLKN